MGQHNRHRAGEDAAERRRSRDYDAEAVARLLRRRAAARAAAEGRVEPQPMDYDRKVVGIIQLLGDWDPETGQATGLLAQCAEDPSVISGFREISDHITRVYTLAFPIALDGAKERGYLAQDGRQPFGYASLGVLSGVTKPTAQSNTNRGRDLMALDRAKVGISDIRKRRGDRIRAIGLANVIPMPKLRRRKAAGE